MLQIEFAINIGLDVQCTPCISV